MADAIARAKTILREFKGDAYAFGFDVLNQIGPFAAELAGKSVAGKRAMFVGPVQFDWFTPYKDRVIKYLTDAGLEVVDVVQGAAPNAPFVDVYRIHSHIMHKRPDVLVVMDSGSSIDSVKAAAVIATLGDISPEIDPYFGVGKVTEACQQAGRKIMPVLAVMTAASSGAHLTKYSNITDPVKGQKKLIVDDAITPPRAVFDYKTTLTQPVLSYSGRRSRRMRPLSGDLLWGPGRYGGQGTRGGGGRNRSPGIGSKRTDKGPPKPRRPNEAGIRHRPGRLCHHDRRHQRSASQQLFSGGCTFPRACVRPYESVLYCFLRSGD